MTLEFELYHYIFLGIGAVLSFFLVARSGVSDKLEHYCLTFFLLTGNFNEALTFKIPGVSLFEIQPVRFLFLLFSFFIFRKLLFSKQRFFENQSPWKLPAFMIFLLLNIVFVIISLFKHTADIGFSEVIVKVVLILNFLVIVYAFRILMTPKSFNLLGKTIAIGAVITCILSFIQVDPLFTKISSACDEAGTTSLLSFHLKSRSDKNDLLLDSLTNVEEIPAATVGETTDDEDMVDLSSLRGQSLKCNILP